MFENFDFRNLLLMVVPVLLAFTVHEYAHALAAYKLGDSTAKNEGRLTLNPLVHLDPVGTLVLFVSQLVGWPKPTPFNPANFRNPARDATLVALAGPVSNLITAVLVAIVFKLFVSFNLFQLVPRSSIRDLFDIFSLAILINVSIGVFSLLPLPPLDGFAVLSYFLPGRLVATIYQNSTAFFVGFLVLIVLGLPQKVIGPVIYFLQSIIYQAILV
jgi:Zn-dependent proteases